MSEMHALRERERERTSIYYHATPQLLPSWRNLLRRLLAHNEGTLIHIAAEAFLRSSCVIIEYRNHIGALPPCISPGSRAAKARLRIEMEPYRLWGAVSTSKLRLELLHERVISSGDFALIR